MSFFLILRLENQLKILQSFRHVLLYNHEVLIYTFSCIEIARLSSQIRDLKEQVTCIYLIIVDMQLLYVVRKMIPWINMPMNEFLKGHYLITVLATMSIVGGIEKTLTTLKCIIRLWKIFNWRICNTVQNGI